MGLGLLVLGPACYFTTSCVAEGAQVSTPQGPRAIERLRVGDAVWAVDPATGQRVSTRITEIRSATRECLALQLGTEALECTPDHPIYSPASNAYVPAVSFLEGRAHEILRVDDEGARVEPVLSVRSDVGLRRVFDLTVESEHHNFIANGVLVHNKSPGCNDGETDNICDDYTTGPGPTSGSSTEGTADDTTGDGESSGSSSDGESSGSSGDGSSGGSSGDGESSGSSGNGESSGSSSGG